MNKIMQILFVILLSQVKFNLAFADNLKQAVEIAAHGTRFQAERLKIAAENLANEDSTGATPGADAYRRKVIFANNKYNAKLGTRVITTKKS
jgi:flagellar basal-body rod protein FlgC